MLHCKIIKPYFQYNIQKKILKFVYTVNNQNCIFTMKTDHFETQHKLKLYYVQIKLFVKKNWENIFGALFSWTDSFAYPVRYISHNTLNFSPYLFPCSKRIFPLFEASHYNAQSYWTFRNIRRNGEQIKKCMITACCSKKVQKNASKTQFPSFY